MNRYVLLPESYAAGITASAAKWGDLRARHVDTERLTVIDGWTDGADGGRTGTSDLTRFHFSKDAPRKVVAGHWYVADPEVHALHEGASRIHGAVPLTALTDRIEAHWRAVPPGLATFVILLTRGHAAEEPKWSVWCVAGEQATPWPFDLWPEASDILKPVADAGWPVEKLAAELVAVIGVGSIGSAAAEQLAMYGIRTLFLVDPDIVKPHNIARMRLTPGDIGRRKVNAVAKRITDRDVNAQIGALPFDVIDDADLIRPLLKEMSAVLVCSDGYESRSVANHLACWAGIPAIFACVQEGGAIGEIIRVRQHRTGCLRCVRQDLYESGGMDPEPALDRGYGEGSRHLPMTAVGGNLSLIGDLAAYATACTLLERIGDRGHTLPGDYAVVGLSATPGLASPFDFTEAGHLRWQPMSKPRANCPSCST